MDAGVGRVMDTLRETGIESDTLVFYVSDNGGQLDAGAYNGPLRGEKQEMYEGGIRVPCCAQWPGHIEPGTVSDRVAMLMDLFPTACDAAGIEPPQGIDACSILPTLLGKDQDFSNREYYWVRREHNDWQGHLYFGQDYHAVRKGDMKLLHNDAFSAPELYRLSSDPYEANDLVAGNPEKLKELAGIMQRQVRKAGAVPWQSPKE